MPATRAVLVRRISTKHGAVLAHAPWNSLTGSLYAYVRRQSDRTV